MNYTTSREGSDWRVDAVIQEDTRRQLLTRKISITRHAGTEDRTSVERHVLRTFTRNDVVKLLVAAGFDVELTRTYGAQELPPRRLGFIARKRPT